MRALCFLAQGGTEPLYADDLSHAGDASLRLCRTAKHGILKSIRSCNKNKPQRISSLRLVFVAMDLAMDALLSSPPCSFCENGLISAFRASVFLLAVPPLLR